MTERIRRFALAALGVWFLLWGTSNWITTVHELRRFYTNVPIWDALDYLSHYSRYRRFDLRVLWLQHNEHRTIGTEILYAIDMLFFHERQILITLVSVVTYAGVLLVLIGFAFYRHECHWTTTCAALLAAAIAGYKMCVVSLTVPFLTCWPQCEFFGIAAIAAIALHKKQGGKLMLWVGIGCSVGSTYSVASGMFVWPVLLLCSFLLQFAKREVGLIALSGAVSIALYFFHYTDLHTLQPDLFFASPAYGLEFLGSFLGMPFGAAYGVSNPWLALLFGWAAVMIAASDLVFIVRRRLFREPTVLVLGGFCCLILISAATTTMGRMNPADPYLVASRAGRYITEPTLFWCALVMMTVWLIGRSWRGFAAIAFMFAIALFAMVTLPRTEDYYAWWEAYVQRGQWAAIALANGVMDKRVMDILYPDPNYVLKYEHILTDNHLAVFADPEPAWIGRFAKDLFVRGADGSVHGDLTTVKKRGGDYEVQGWADGATTVVFIDNIGHVLGFGKRPGAGPAELYTFDVPKDLAFTGFIRGGTGEKEFSVWALDRNERHMFRMGRLEIQLPR